MNLEDSDKFAEAQRLQAKKRRIVMISIFLCLVLVVLLVVLIMYIKHEDALQLKLYIDEEQKVIPSDLFISKNDTTYVDIRQITEMLGYTYTKGEYQKFNENEDSCYVSNDLEATAMTANEKTFTKITRFINDYRFIIIPNLL